VWINLCECVILCGNMRPRAPRRPRGPRNQFFACARVREENNSCENISCVMCYACGENQ